VPKIRYAHNSGKIKTAPFRAGTQLASFVFLLLGLAASAGKGGDRRKAVIVPCRPRPESLPSGYRALAAASVFAARVCDADRRAGRGGVPLFRN
jgi:hypothetical protein